MAFRDKTKTALVTLLESHGEDQVVDILHEGIEKKTFRPEDFSLREIYVSINSILNPNKLF